MAATRAKLLLIVSLGVVLRLSLRFSSYYGEISNRVEISSPVNAWERVVEAVTLLRWKVSPYSGDTFHESPLFLAFYRLLIGSLSDLQIALLFIAVDVLTAFVLAKVCSAQLNCTVAVERGIEEEEELKKKNKKTKPKKKEKDDEEKREDEVEDDDDEATLINLKDPLFSGLFIQPETVSTSAFWSAAIYLLAPYSILACVAQATTVLGNFLIGLTLLAATSGHRAASLLLLALLTLNAFYPLILLSPVVLMLEQRWHLDQQQQQGKKKSLKKSKESSFSSANPMHIELSSSATRLSIAGSVLLFALFYGLLMAASYWLEGGSLQFLQSNYVFMWSVGDLTPNIGLFWYFFTEMFDHFRDFFLCVFQINYFIYIIPLTFNFWRNPYLISMISLIIHSLFKPYPTVSDFALYLALLPMWSHIFESMKSTLVISATIVTTSVLAPILWYLWIVLGTANANFYFGITIGYNVAQIFLTTDLMFAYVKREFHLRNLLLYKLCKQTGKVPKIELSF